MVTPLAMRIDLVYRLIAPGPFHGNVGEMASRSCMNSLPAIDGRIYRPVHPPFYVIPQSKSSHPVEPALSKIIASKSEHVTSFA